METSLGKRVLSHVVSKIPPNNLQKIVQPLPSLSLVLSWTVCYGLRTQEEKLKLLTPFKNGVFEFFGGREGGLGNIPFFPSV